MALFWEHTLNFISVPHSSVTVGASAAPFSSGGGVGLGGTPPVVGSGTSTTSTKPDMSHLTAEERAIIQNVMSRQQSEESKEVEFLR